MMNKLEAEPWRLISPHNNNKFEIRIAKKTAKIKIYSELTQFTSET